MFAGIVAGVLGWARLELARREHGLRAAIEEQASEDRKADRSDRMAEKLDSQVATAAAQLGHAQPSVRFAGLAALESIAAHHDTQRVYDIVCAFARDNLPIDVTRLENVIHLSYTQDSNGTSVTDHDGILGGPDRHHPPIDYGAAIKIALRAPRGTRIDLRRTLIVDADIDISERNGDTLNVTDAVIVDSRFNGDPVQTLTFFKISRAALFKCDWTLAQGAGITLKHCRVFESDLRMRGTVKSLRLDHCRLIDCDLGVREVSVDLSINESELQAVRLAGFGTVLTSNIRNTTFDHCDGDVRARQVHGGNNNVKNSEIVGLDAPTYGEVLP